MAKIKNLLKYLLSNNISLDQALEMIEEAKKGKKPKQKAIIENYEKRYGG